MKGVPSPSAATERDLAVRLARRTLELVDVPSESRHEAAVLDLVERTLRGGPELRVERDDAVVLATPVSRRADRPFVVLAGHADTVPAQANLPGRADGEVVAGLGATDMKGALAVMLELAGEDPAGELDVGYLFFGREELPIVESALLPFLRGHASTREISLAIVMEPTDNTIQVGCLGNLNAVVTFRGRGAHSARPWLGRNAIHAAILGLSELASSEPRDVTIDDLTYREVMNVTTIEGGIAGNVVPDTVRCRINVRYAPGRTPADAEDELRRLVAAPDVDVEIVGNAPPGGMAVNDPLVERLRTVGDLEIGPKQAWTPVAEFADIGVNAVNFGPGDPALAHRADESVRIAALVRSYELLRAFAGRF